MSDVRDFNTYVDEHTPRIVGELMCVRCYHRWIGAWPEGLQLKDIHCPLCDRVGSTIMTGQYLDDEE
jgi:hypothetical protein